MAKPHVHVIIAADQIPTPVQTGLQQLRVSTSFWPLPAALNDGLRNAGDAVLIVADSAAPDIVSRLEVLLDRLAERPRPTLLVVLNGPLTRKPAPPALLPLVTAIDPQAPELIAKLTTLLELRGSFAALTAVGDEVRAQHEQLQTRYRDQLRVASLVQRELTAPALTRVGPVRFHSLFRPAEAVSGDVLELAHLDEHRVGFFLADASGHGLPAAMLTMFIRRALHANEHRTTASPSPAATLERLNEDLCRSNLSECPYVAAICGVLDIRTLELRFARAGAPYPLIRTTSGVVALRRSEGSVLGVRPGAHFEIEHVQLAPGDSFLAYSDGLDRVMRPHMAAERLAGAFQQAALALASEAPAPAFRRSHGAASSTVLIDTDYPVTITDPDLAISNTPWFELFGQEGPAAAIEQAKVRIDSLRRMGEKLDDLTLLALEVDEA